LHCCDGIEGYDTRYDTLMIKMLKDMKVAKEKLEIAKEKKEAIASSSLAHEKNVLPLITGIYIYI
jgi:hypothetical protein